MTNWVYSAKLLNYHGATSALPPTKLINLNYANKKNTTLVVPYCCFILRCIIFSYCICPHAFWTRLNNRAISNGSYNPLRNLASTVVAVLRFIITLIANDDDNETRQRSNCWYKNYYCLVFSAAIITSSGSEQKKQTPPIQMCQANVHNDSMLQQGSQTISHRLSSLPISLVNLSHSQVSYNKL